jgi:hypothetical protein
MEINGKEYEVGIDVGQGDIPVEEHYIGPSADWPDGSYIKKVGGEVLLATGYYAILHPDKKSLAWYGDRPPFATVEK